MSFTCFRTRQFIFRKTVVQVYAAVVRYLSHTSVYGGTDACKTYHTITAYTTIFLKLNIRFRNMQKTSKFKIKILIYEICISLVYVV